MPADKDAAKRRRQARNRQERDNRQARTEGAKRAATRPPRTAAETPETSLAKGAKGGRATSGRTTPSRSTKAAAPSKGKDGRPSRTLAGDEVAPARSGGLLGSLFPPRPDGGGKGGDARSGRPVRPPSEVVEVDADPGLRGNLQRWSAQPGGRSVLLALFAAIVLGLTLIAFPVLPSDDLSGYGQTVVEARVEAADGDDGDVDDAVAEFDRNPIASVRAVELRSPRVFIVLLGLAVPIVLSAVAVRSLLSPTRSRTLLFCAIGTGMAAFVGGGGLPLLLVTVILGWGAWQSSKADKAAAAAAA